VERCYNGGTEIGDLGTQRQSISSIRVYGPAAITVFENTEFGGHSEVFAANVPDLGLQEMSAGTAWDNHIDSLRVSEVSEIRLSPDPYRTPEYFRTVRNSSIASAP
jgi:hypothetical protein